MSIILYVLNNFLCNFALIHNCFANMSFEIVYFFVTNTMNVIISYELRYLVYLFYWYCSYK